MWREVEGWERCNRCHRIVYTGAIGGTCWNGRPHDVTGSTHYSVPLTWDGADGAQSGWDRCARCQCLFFTENPTFGRCTPRGDVHEWSGRSTRHFVWHTWGDGAVSGWRWCSRCESLFEAVDLDGVTCWDGRPHDSTGSGDYFLTAVPRPRRRLAGLVVRPADQAVLGVEWTGMEQVLGPTSALVSQGGGTLSLTVPPQHIAEAPVSWASWGSLLTEGIGRVPPGAGIAMLAGDYPGGPIVVSDLGDLLIGSEVVGGRTFRPGAPVAVAGTEVFAVDVDGALCRLAEGLWQAVSDDAPAHRFASGAAVAAETLPRDGLAVYIAKEGSCLTHVDARGWLPPLRLPSANTSFAPARKQLPGIVYVAGGRIGRELFDGAGEGWTISTSEPCPGALVTGQPVASVTLEGIGPLYAVSDADGTAGVYEPLTSRWSPLARSAAPAGHLSLVVSASAAGVDFLLWLFGVDRFGALTASGLVRGDGWVAARDASRYSPQIGDWCPPGAPVAAQSTYISTRVYCVGGDRTVRSSSYVAGGWQPELPGSANPGLARPLWQSAGTGLPEVASQSGPSRITVAVNAGERLDLTAATLFERFGGRTLLAPTQGQHGTRLELPWGLWLSIEPGFCRLNQVAPPQISPRGDRAVWRSAITPGLPLTPLAVRTDREFDDSDPWAAARPALEGSTRFDLLGSGSITANRLELSALGAWFSAFGSWDDGAWSQEVVGGRDIRIGLDRRGILLPFGHAAVYRERIERRFDPRPDRTTAVLHLTASLEITEPVATFPAADTAESRGFPFTEVEILQPAYGGLDRAESIADGGDPYFRPSIGGVPIQVPVALRRGGHQTIVSLPVIFSESADGAAGVSSDAWAAAAVDLQLGGGPVPLAGGSLFDTHALRVEGGVHPTTGRAQPRVASARIRVPALDALGAAPQVYDATLGRSYLDFGDTELALAIGEQTIDFAKHANRSGGVASPSFKADAVSAAGGLTRQALGAFDPRTYFEGLNAKLLGLVRLPEVLADGARPPVITSLIAPDDHVPRTTYSWQGVPLKSASPFEAGDACRMSLIIESAVGAPGRPPRTHTEGTITDFSLGLAGVLKASIGTLKFRSDAGLPPKLEIEGFAIEFAGDLSFLDFLIKAMTALSIEPPVSVAPEGNAITLSQQVALPEISLGAGPFSVTLRGAVFSARLKLPYDGALEVDLSFGTRQAPFLVGIWILGGGGYLELKIRDGRLVSMVAGVEIGGLWSFNWVVVAGEVHALAGIRIELVEGRARLSGSLRVGGSVEVLGVISVGIEIAAEITAGESDAGRFQVSAAARIVIEVDLFLVSADVDISEDVVIYEAPAEQAVAGFPAPRIEDAEATWTSCAAANIPPGKP